MELTLFHKAGSRESLCGVRHFLKCSPPPPRHPAPPKRRGGPQDLHHRGEEHQPRHPKPLPGRVDDDGVRPGAAPCGGGGGDGIWAAPAAVAFRGVRQTGPGCSGLKFYNSAPLTFLFHSFSHFSDFFFNSLSYIIVMPEPLKHTPIRSAAGSNPLAFLAMGRATHLGETKETLWNIF